jgi:WD40 repeat protein
MEKQKLWLTAGKDNKLLHWNIPLGVKDGELLQKIDIHSDEITDVVEVLNPKCVATCSMDKTIVLFDIVHREHLRTISDGHGKGIKHLKYNFSTGG